MDILTPPKTVDKHVIDVECAYPSGIQGITLVEGTDEYREDAEAIYVVAGAERQQITFYKAHLCWSRVVHRVIKYPVDQQGKVQDAGAIAEAIRRAAEGRLNGPVGLPLGGESTSL